MLHIMQEMIWAQHMQISPQTLTFTGLTICLMNTLHHTTMKTVAISSHQEVDIIHM